MYDYLVESDCQKTDSNANENFEIDQETNPLAPLIAIDNWVCWKWKEDTNTGKRKKPPYQARNPSKPADTNDPNTWSDYHTACQARDNDDSIDGIGFVLTGTPFAAFDLDDCIVNDGPAPWAKKLIEDAGSYTEMTPSGDGIRIIGTAQGPRADTGKMTMPVGSLEIFRKAIRYITITSWSTDVPRKIKNIDAIIDASLPKKADKKTEPPKHDQDEWARIRSALFFIPADNRGIWLKIGAALESTGWTGAESLWREWSETSFGLFDEADQIKTWNNFAKYQGQKAGIGSIFELAMEYGWSNKKGLPQIRIDTPNVEEIVNETEQALIAADRGIYQRGGQIVCVKEELVLSNKSGEIMRQHIHQLGEYALIEHMSASATFERYDGRSKSVVEVSAPMSLAKTLQQRSRLNLPLLTGIINAPTLRADGSLISEPGYDPETGLLFDPQGVEFPAVLEKPTKEDAEAGLSKLKFLLSTFRFETDADRSVALSAILTAIVRKSAIAFAPMHCYDASLPGTGKSKLVDITSVIATGREAGIVAQAKSEEEMEKRLASLLISGDAIALDNCDVPVNSSFLCSILTQTIVKPRILGKSETPSLPTNIMVTATGNNLRIAGDLTRRSLICRIDPETERPELRIFKNDPVADAKAQRPQLIVAGLTMLKAYLVAGCPCQVNLGSFEDWSKLIRSTLIWLGEIDPVETMERLRENDPILDEKRVVMDAWKDLYADRKVEVSDIIKLCSADEESLADPQRRENLRTALLPIAGMHGEVDGKRLGFWLRKNRGATLDGSTFQLVDKRQGFAIWSLQSAKVKSTASELSL